MKKLKKIVVVKKIDSLSGEIPITTTTTKREKHPQTGYDKYLDKNGYHFTDDLSEYASKYLKNVNGDNHHWPSYQVKRALDNLGLSIPSKVTMGDITYLANMYYSDFYPDIIRDETTCIKAAYNMANDPDGYEGMIFKRWVTDAMSRDFNIEWEKYI